MMYARCTGPDDWAAEARVRGSARKHEINGTLRNTRRLCLKDDHRGPCLRGQVYGDTKGRFRDGEFITTSTIVREEGDVFMTRYSVYRVESWADQPETQQDGCDAIKKVHALLGMGHSWGYIGDLHGDLLDALLRTAEEGSVGPAKQSA